MTRHSLSAALLLALALLNVGAVDSAVGARVTWGDATAAPGEVITGPDGRPWLRVVHTGGPRTVALAKIDFPPTFGDFQSYAVTGLLQHRGVEGSAYVEMWSLFADGSRFFSRTLASTGPMARLHGDTPRPRRLILPFYLKDSRRRPTQLLLNLVMPGPGTVEIGPLELEGFRAGLDPLTHATVLQCDTGEWWRERTGGLIGGIAGGALGLLGALVGVLAGVFRAYRPVRAILVTALLASVASLGLGVAAIWNAQPYHVWYPPVLLSAIAVPLSIGGLLLVAARRRREELRRINAADAV